MRRLAADDNFQYDTKPGPHNPAVASPDACEPSTGSFPTSPGDVSISVYDANMMIESYQKLTWLTRARTWMWIQRPTPRCLSWPSDSITPSCTAAHQVLPSTPRTSNLVDSQSFPCGQPLSISYPTTLSGVAIFCPFDGMPWTRMLVLCSVPQNKRLSSTPSFPAAAAIRRPCPVGKYYVGDQHCVPTIFGSIHLACRYARPRCPPSTQLLLASGA
jgi:hypothetical protein